MTNPVLVEEADRLLDELEELARSSTASVEFYAQFLDRLRVLVNAKSASVLSVIPPDRWIIIAENGEVSSSVFEEFRARYTLEPNANDLLSAEESLTWYAYPLRSDNIVYGCILLTFQGLIPASAMPALRGMTTAFGEVFSVRQHKCLESIFGSNWTDVHGLIHQISICNVRKKAASILVNRLLSIVSAARVSLAAQSGGVGSIRTKLIAVSSVSTIDRSSSVVKSLEGLAGEALQQSQPIVHQVATSRENRSEEGSRSLSIDGTFPNLLGLRFYIDEQRSVNEKDILILEWATQEAMLDATPAITHFLPSLCATWQQQQRWLRVPSFIRWFVMWRQAPLIKRLASSWVRPLVFLGGLLLCIWLLMRPYPFSIESDAILEPVSRRAIHASVDGFIDELFVEDGQSIKVGQVLARLRSPMLELQIEETIGQIRAFIEKRDGLRVAVNQLSLSSPDSEATQTRLSADILLLDTQEKLVKEKLAFLTQEKNKLAIESPIDGVIVSRELRQELESRPLRRGDTLFSVVNLEGEWQLDARVADRDSGYLIRHYQDSKQDVTFVFDSLPEEQFQGTITKISSVMENSSGKESFLHVFMSIEGKIARKAHVGANARVFFICGSQPTWFVWCRPLVEALQKRVWLFFDTKTLRIQDAENAN